MATCFCGAVQLKFVSPAQASFSSILVASPSESNADTDPANPGPRSHLHICLQLRGLPESHRFYVRVTKSSRLEVNREFQHKGLFKSKIVGWSVQRM
jgi:hypothetical protein